MTRVFKPDSGQVLEIQDEGGSAALTIETDGNVTVDAGNLVIGTAGQGIDFAAQTVSSETGTTPDTSAGDEVLNHYETGSWTGVISDGTNSMSMTSNTGYYTKIGNLVTVTGLFEVDSISSASGAIRMTGLPFSIANNYGNSSGGGVGWGGGFALPTAGFSVGYHGVPNQTYISLMVWDATAGTTAMQASEWSASGYANLNFSYRAA